MTYAALGDFESLIYTPRYPLERTTYTQPKDPLPKSFTTWYSLTRTNSSFEDSSQVTVDVSAQFHGFLSGADATGCGSAKFVSSFELSDALPRQALEVIPIEPAKESW